MSMSVVGERVGLHPILEERWSPRAFEPAHAMTPAEVDSLVEAARWAPSANNSQPWRYIIARRGTATFDRLAETLAAGNRVWAETASLLIVALAQQDEPGTMVHRWGAYDLGQSVAHLTVQAHALGYHAHQMGGFDAAAIRAAFGLGEDLEPLSVTAVGRVGDPSMLPEPYRAREIQPRDRLGSDEIVLVND